MGASSPRSLPDSGAQGWLTREGSLGISALAGPRWSGPGEEEMSLLKRVTVVRVMVGLEEITAKELYERDMSI